MKLYLTTNASSLFFYSRTGIQNFNLSHFPLVAKTSQTSLSSPLVATHLLRCDKLSGINLILTEIPLIFLRHLHTEFWSTEAFLLRLQQPNRVIRKAPWQRTCLPNESMQMST